MQEAWIRYWANRYRWATEQRNDIDYEDLYQAAFVGAYIAKLKYTQDKGKFSTFSSFYIRKEIRNLLGIKNGKIPPVTVSLDEPISEDDDATRLDLIEDETIPDKEETLYEQERRQGVRAAIERLPDQQRQAMALFYFQGKGLQEIGKTLGISPRQVAHVIERARLAMRRDKLLRELVEIKPPYYMHVGINRFRTTQTSAVEAALLILEAHKARIMGSLSRLQEQDTQEDDCKQEEKVV